LAHWVKKNRSSLLTIFTIPNSAKNPVGMKSVLRTGNYVNREGGYYSDIKKDGYSKGLEIISSDEFIQQMISGRPMREQTIEIEISAIGPEIFVLFDHEVNYILSQWT
jgi:hypothetical protein